MISRKLLALLMTILIFAMAVPASAANYSTKITGICNLPDIRVSVPATMDVIINPYEIPVEVEGVPKDGQILCEPSYIENKSPMPLKVSIAISGAVKSGSNMLMSSYSTKDTGLTSKRAFMFLEIMTADDNNPNSVSWSQEYNEEKHIIVSKTVKRRTNFLTLGAAEQKGCFGVFRLSGDCIPNPKIGWTEADGVHVKIVFSFKPIAITSV